MGKALRRAGVEGDDYREIRLFPHRGEGVASFTLYEDDGESNAAFSGERLRIELVLNSAGDCLDFDARPEGSYRPGYRDLVLLLPQGESRGLRYRGAELETVLGEDGRRRARIGLF